MMQLCHTSYLMAVLTDQKLIRSKDVSFLKCPLPRLLSASRASQLGGTTTRREEATKGIEDVQTEK